MSHHLPLQTYNISVSSTPEHLDEVPINELPALLSSLNSTDSVIELSASGNDSAGSPNVAQSVSFEPTGLQLSPSLPNLTTLQHPANFAMEQSWPSQPSSGFYSYYTPEALRSAERSNASPGQSMHTYDEPTHRRANTLPHSSSFLSPPPPPAHASHSTGSNNNMNLPPFSQTFYPTSYQSNAANHGGNQSTPSNIHALPHNVGYSPHISMSAPSSGNYHYPLTSPLSLTDSMGQGGHRVPPPHSYSESPRIPGYSSSPGLHHFSPTSPTNNLIHGVHPSSASTSSSSFPSVARNSANLPKNMKRRSTSGSHSNGSWDEDRYNMPTSTEMEIKELGPDGPQQPWGMPQDEYKALNPRDKKQVRNRIGARRFRAKRKDYVSNLEVSLRGRDDEIHSLKAQLNTQRSEINELRQRLGLPHLPDPEPIGLGLVVGTNGNIGSSSGNDGWSDAKLEQGI